MKKIARFADGLSGLSAILAGLMLLLMVSHIILEMVLRTFFNRSTFVLDEFVGYEVAGLTALGLGHALRTGGLIRVSLLTRVLSDWQHRALELAVIVLTLAVCAFFCRYQYLAIDTSFARGTRSNTLAGTPLWLPMSVFLVGIIVFMIQLVAYALSVISGGEILGSNEEAV
jgi:TRAP-type C4-dicarboxylate transport system permease small subunit